ncbi:MAG TPA: aspartate aminotransferase family protein [Thermoleophilaceae bacterium]|nr:aspartate aminotransferase family protein [Thermoleophilaceae bacterium]
MTSSEMSELGRTGPAGADCCEVYAAMTPASRRCAGEAAAYLPGGDSRTPLFHAPYPLGFEEGRGCRVVDLDGNELLDFTGNHSSLIHGYGHPRLLEAVADQLRKGTAFPGLTRPQVEFARQLCERVESLELLRFTNSGTEATLQAVRAARAYTGRHVVAKIEGGYNGTWDEVMVSTHPSAEEAGDLERPAAVPATEGLGPQVESGVLVLPFNDEAAMRRLLEERGASIAAVVVEPVLGSAGMIPADAHYLRTLREVTRRMGIVLIFDEVISFRVAYGGAQEHYGVSPDLTCLGKAIGGGFPLGVVGGRSDIMAVFDPSEQPPRVPHPGSYNANPLSLAAGAASLELLTQGEVDRLNRHGDTLRSELSVAFAEAGLAVQVTGLGSLFGIHFLPRPVKSYRDALCSDKDRRHRLFLGLIGEGVLIDPRGTGCLSTAIGKEELDELVGAVREVAPSLAEADDRPGESPEWDGRRRG